MTAALINVLSVAMLIASVLSIPSAAKRENNIIKSVSESLSHESAVDKLQKALEILDSLENKDMNSLAAEDIQLLATKSKMLQENHLFQQQTADDNEDDRIQNVENQHQKRTNLGSPAFTVELSTTRSVSDQVALTFDNIITDELDDFTPVLGTYRVPQPGVYAFYWSVDAPAGSVQTVLVKNGQDMKYGPSTLENLGYFSGTASTSAIVECNRDDLVWIKVQSWPDEFTCNMIDANYTSFTGLKIYNSSSNPDASAFMAQLSVNQSFAAPHIIAYDSVLVNIGSDYYPTNGSFVCTENEPHVFTVSAHFVSSFNNVSIYQNSGLLMYIVLPLNSNHQTSDSGTSSATIVVDCAGGDVITVRSEPEHLAIASSLTGYRLVDTAWRNIVAFTAVPAEIRDYRDKQIIEFDRVITNIGESYFPGISNFVCPDEDLYLLSWEIAISSESTTRSGEARLVMARQGQKQVVKTGPRTGQVFVGTNSRSASTQAIVRCEENAAFFIEAVVESGFMEFSAGFAYFTGFRLPSFD